MADSLESSLETHDASSGLFAASDALMDNLISVFGQKLRLPVVISADWAFLEVELGVCRVPRDIVFFGGDASLYFAEPFE